jgi:hypothetical protein
MDYNAIKEMFSKEFGDIATKFEIVHLKIDNAMETKIPRQIALAYISFGIRNMT